MQPGWLRVAFYGTMVLVAMLSMWWIVYSAGAEDGERETL